MGTPTYAGWFDLSDSNQLAAGTSAEIFESRITSGVNRMGRSRSKSSSLDSMHIDFLYLLLCMVLPKTLSFLNPSYDQFWADTATRPAARRTKKE